MTTIYMPLLNEGVDVWRLVEAAQLSDGTYRIDGEMPDGEEWAFTPGTVVRCESRTFGGGQGGLTATGVAD